MFAQEILTEMGRLHSITKAPMYEFAIKYVMELIKKAHKFHMGDYDVLYDLFQNRIGKMLFVEDAEYLKLPYDTVYFDGIVTRYTGLDAVPKRAIVVQKIIPDYWLYFSIGYSEFKNHWMLNPVAFVIHIGEPVTANTIIGVLNSLMPPQFQKPLEPYNEILTTAIPLILLPQTATTQYDVKKVIEEEQFDFTTLSNFLTLLNCRNVRSIEIKNSTTKKKGKRGFGGRALPMFTYHVLKLNLPKNKEDNDKSTDHNEAMRHYRKHFCRGHIRIYDEDAPLFGKYVGPVWIPAHLRGTEPGFVDKDYKAVINE